MARRALFCPRCTELLEQVEKAADAVCHGESAFREVRQKALDDGSRTQIDLRIQYLTIKERAQKHLERHIRSRSADPISCVRLRA
jgi:hypothetical protein